MRQEHEPTASTGLGVPWPKLAWLLVTLSQGRIPSAKLESVSSVSLAEAAFLLVKQAKDPDRGNPYYATCVGIHASGFGDQRRSAGSCVCLALRILFGTLIPCSYPTHGPPGISTG